MKGTEIQEKVNQKWLELKSDGTEGNLSKYNEEMNAPKLIKAANLKSLSSILSKFGKSKKIQNQKTSLSSTSSCNQTLDSGVVIDVQVSLSPQKEEADAKETSDPLSTFHIFNLKRDPNSCTGHHKKWAEQCQCKDCISVITEKYNWT